MIARRIILILNAFIEHTVGCKSDIRRQIRCMITKLDIGIFFFGNFVQYYEYLANIKTPHFTGFQRILSSAEKKSNYCLSTIMLSKEILIFFVFG